jgi:hypothetical protein
MHYPAWIFIACLMGGVFLAVAELSAGHRKEWERHPHRRLDDPARGPAWYTGRVVAVRILESSYLKRPAVYCSLSVRQYKMAYIDAQTGSTEQWRVAHAQARREAFALADEAAQAGVELGPAAIFLKPRFDATLREGDAEMIARLEAAGVNEAKRFAREGANIVEELIEPGETVSVFGTLSREASPARLSPRAIWSAGWREAHLRGARRAYAFLRACAGAAFLAAAVMAVRMLLG